MKKSVFAKIKKICIKKNLVFTGQAVFTLIYTFSTMGMQFYMKYENAHKNVPILMTNVQKCIEKITITPPKENLT